MLNLFDLAEQELVSLDRALQNPVAMWLMAAYAYESLDSLIMDDHTFDRLGEHIRDNYDRLQHPHKYLVDRERCAFTGTGYTKPPSEWPSRILSATHQLLDELHGKNWQKEQTFASYREVLEKLKAIFKPGSFDLFVLADQN